MTTVKTKEIQELRDKLASQSYYDDKWLGQFALVAKWINSFADTRDKLLEVGCGCAFLSNCLACHYTGIDPIKHKDLREEVDFKVGLGENIPYPDKSFNYVLVKDAINYFSDLSPFFDETSRVLTDNGAVLITEFVGAKYHPAKQRLKNVIKRYLRIGLNMWNRTYLNYYTSHDVMRAAERYGFSTEYKYLSANLRYYLVIRKNHGTKL